MGEAGAPGTGRDRLPGEPGGRPDSARTAYRLAWSRVAGRGRADPGEAVRWARVTVAAEPANALYHSTLGASLYRAGRFLRGCRRAAGQLPPPGARRRPGQLRAGLAVTGDVPATAGPAEARAALAEALRWRAARPDLRPDRAATFDRLLREARSVLDGPLPDLPVDVFAR
jgi:hypothetical protein